MSLPEAYVCPITQKLMLDPVLDPDGNSFERDAIMQWLDEHRTSPITRQPLYPGQLRPNRALKTAIEEFLLTHTETGEPISQDTAPPSVPAQPAVVHHDAPVRTNEGLELKSVLFTLDDASKQAGDTALCLSVIPPSGGEHTPSNICCVVDVSYSMNDAADVKGETGASTSFGFTILDIVKHAVKTIVGLLGPEDKFSLVKFSDSAEVVLPLVRMDDAGKKDALEKLDKLRPEFRTNLWDGLKLALNLISNDINTNPSGRFSHIVLLTDGVPNISPSAGEVEALRVLKNENPALHSCTLNTFGFGYNLDSPLLINLAKTGNGQYVFIPECSLVGTVFVHAVSNLLSAVAIDASIQLEVVDPDVRIFEDSRRQKSFRVELGNILYGQPRDVIVTLKGVHAGYSATNLVSATLTCKQLSAVNTPVTTVATVTSDQYVDELNATKLHATAAALRLKFAQTVSKALSQASTTSDPSVVISDVVTPYINELTEFIQQTENLLADFDDDDGKLNSLREFAKALLEDVKGQVCTALSKEEYLSKWGKHFLPSLSLAHSTQIRNNFKDPGVQFYGGKLFERLKTKGDEIFTTIPPPKPSGRMPRNVNGAPAAAQPVTSMRAFHNRMNPCFAGECSVALADGTARRVKHIRKGDRVLSAGGQPATVVCVVQTNTTNPEDPAVFACLPNSSLLVTPYHPIRVNGEWCFPVDAAGGKLQARSDCPAVFSFVLDSNHVMSIEGVECVTLGHGFTDNAAVSHEYFGTSRVIDDLSVLPGWQTGHVVISQVKRDPVTQRINGLA